LSALADTGPNIFGRLLDKIRLGLPGLDRLNRMSYERTGFVKKTDPGATRTYIDA
jgi:hypothetical protein